MAEETPLGLKPDPVAGRRHAREKFNAIYAPVILAACGLAALLVAFVILSSGAIEGRLSILADALFVCFTLLPCILGALLLFLVMALMAFGVNQLNRWLPTGVFARLRGVVDRLDGFVKRAASAAARPVTALNARLFSWEHNIERLGSSLTFTSKERSTDERE